MSKNMFFGREKEIAWLRGEFDACAVRNEKGEFSGPRMAFVIAETGVGKSRLVQELYHQLASDETWNFQNYWPNTFGEYGQQMSVAPEMSEHRVDGPPRFIWLGARWQPVDIRNVQDRRSVLPELRYAVTAHVKIVEQHQSAWAVASNRMIKAVKADCIDEIGGEAVGQMAEIAFAQIPFAGLIWKLGKGAADLSAERLSSPMSHEQIKSEQINSEVDEMLQCMRGLLSGKAAVPTIIWLDDAQWIDSETADFLDRLWKESQKKNYPLLVVVTHYEREWLELKKNNSIHVGECWKREGHSLACFDDGSERVSVHKLEYATNDVLNDYLLSALPGITNTQRKLLVEKSGGNFLTLIENVGELISIPLNFVGGSISGALTEKAFSRIQTFETDRAKRVRQRFMQLDQDVQKILGWSSQFGTRFIRDVIAKYASENLTSEARPEHLIEWCIDPYALLYQRTSSISEFRDKAVCDVASWFRAEFLEDDEAGLIEILRKTLIDLISHNFDKEGNVSIAVDAKDLAMRGKTINLLDDGGQDLSEMLPLVLPLPARLDWSVPSHVASLRGICLTIIRESMGYHWTAVIRHSQTLEGVVWEDVPEQIISRSCRSELLDICWSAQALGLAKILVRNELEFQKGLESKFKSAEALLALSHCLHRSACIEERLGNIENARVGYVECVSMQRSLAHDLNTPQSRRNLALCIDDLASIEKRRGNLESARAGYKESLALRRSLDAEMGSSQSRGDLAFSLANLASVAEQTDELETARAGYLESLAIQRLLADETRTPQSRDALSISLQNVANIEERLGNVEAARSVYGDSLALRRDLVEEFDSPRGRVLLSGILSKIGDLEKKCGNVETTRTCYEESLEISRCLEEELDTIASRYALCDRLKQLGNFENEQGNMEAARVAFGQSLMLLRLTDAEIAVPENLRDRSLGLSGKNTRENISSAKAKYSEYLSLSRRLVDEQNTPENWSRLCTSLVKAARIDQISGDLDAARTGYAESLEIRRRLAEEFDTPEAKRELCDYLQMVIYVDELMGDVDAVRAGQTELLAQLRRLADELGTIASRHAISKKLIEVARFENKHGNREAALACHAENVAIKRRLADESDTPDSWKDLCDSLDYLSRQSILGLSCDPDTAKKSQEELLSHRRFLAKKLATAKSKRELCECIEGTLVFIHDADVIHSRRAEILALRRFLAEKLNDHDSRRDLCSSLEKVATFELEYGSRDSARENYAESLALRRRLADEVEAPYVRSELFICIKGIAGIEWQSGNLEEAFGCYKECLEIIHSSAEELESSESRRDLCEIMSKLGAIEQERGNLNAALKYYSDILSVRRSLANALSGLPDFSDSSFNDYLLTEGLHNLRVSLDRFAYVNYVLGNIDVARAGYVESSELLCNANLAEFEQAQEDLGNFKNLANYEVASITQHQERLGILKAILPDGHDAIVKSTNHLLRLASGQ